MKKLIIATGIIAGICAFSSCSEDDLTIMQDPTTFVLNKPAHADNYIYELEKSTYVELTCSQPDFGYTAATTYKVQVSFNSDFSQYETLGTSHTTAKMQVDASEIAVAATNIGVENGLTEDDFPFVSKLYIRLVAGVANDFKTITSNTIEISGRVHFALPDVNLPEEMYIIGSGIGGWTWGSDAIDMVRIHGDENAGCFWKIVYIGEDADGSCEIKLNQTTEWNGSEFGYEGTTFGGTIQNITSNAGGNISVSQNGWYLVEVRTKLDGRNLLYTVNFYEPYVYLQGDAAGDWELGDNDIFTVPETKDGEFVSPVTVADSGEGLRMCVKLPNIDWWKTEFIFFGDGKIVYRAGGDDQERYQSSKGQVVYLNFVEGTGRLE